MNLDWLLQIIAHYRYWILFPLACFEGPLISFAVGILAARGVFNPLAAYGLLIMGDVIPDTVYYYVGRYGKNTRFVKKILAKTGLERHLERVHSLWYRHTGKTMFFSKLAYGLATPFLISSGMIGLPLPTFLLYAIPITVIQYGILMFGGYYFSNSFGFFSNTLEAIEILVAATVVVATLYYILTLYMRKKLLEEEQK